MNGELRQLFSGGAPGDSETRRFTVLTRYGHPLLYLPRKRAQALTALALYPAQRPLARVARSLMFLACSAGLTRLLPAASLPLAAGAPLGQFLGALLNQKTVPDFAILAGNPNAPGRRFILLLFDAHDRPCAVVKAGTGPEAIRLLEREIAVLQHLPPAALGIPRLRSTHQGSGLHALALDYVQGNAPQGGECHRMYEVLASWIDTTQTIPLGEVPAWQRLSGACPDHPMLKSAQARLESTPFHPVLHHGDFAPWNIKVTRDASWRVLDWERGELIGMPCWDWFHYQVQVGLLVERRSTSAHVQHIECWLANDLLRDYAARAAVEPLIRDLFLAYLLYCVEVTKPSEGLPATRELLNVLAQRWQRA
jgi:hypothetical protein